MTRHREGKCMLWSVPLGHMTAETLTRRHVLEVNRKGDAIAQVATDYTPAEIAYFKAIVCPLSSIIPFSPLPAIGRSHNACTR